MITYACEPPQFKSIWSTVQNRICTVADSFRVTEDLGKIRGQFQLLHKPIFGMKGMAIPVMEFLREGYKVRKFLAKNQLQSDKNTIFGDLE